jgi:hypothetical protein
MIILLLKFSTNPYPMEMIMFTLNEQALQIVPTNAQQLCQILAHNPELRCRVTWHYAEPEEAVVYYDTGFGDVYYYNMKAPNDRTLATNCLDQWFYSDTLVNLKFFLEADY